MKLKNILLSGLSLVLVAALAIGGTVAYLQDDDSDVNVMTLGNVKIEQNEYQRVIENGTYKIETINGEDSYVLEPFEQAKPLLPVTEVDANGAAINHGAGAYGSTKLDMTQVGSQGLKNMFTTKNVQDKIVTVKNTGKSDAYVRTWIALEDPFTEGRIGVNVGSNGYTQDPYWIPVVIDGVQYSVSCFTYNAALKPGEVSSPSLLQVYLNYKATNEDMELLGDTYEILAFSQAVQADGFADAATALKAAFGTDHPWTDGVKLPTIVSTVAELQAAIDAAVNGDIIVLGADIEGDVTVTQKEGVKFTINGNGNTIDGSIIVDGKSQRYETAGITIENVNFAADALSADAYINLGKKGDNNTRYTNNVTVSNCTFDYSGTEDKVAIKSYTGGDRNLTVDGCTAKAGMHSLVQVTNVEKGLTITNCKAYSKNGINLNNTPYLYMSGCEFDTVGYCVRFGVNGATNNGNFTIADSTLKSANDDGDAVIILRGTMTGATLNLKGTTLTGTPDIEGTANIVK